MRQDTYEITSILDEGDKVCVCLAKRKSDGRDVILKSPKGTHKHQSEIAAELMHEYQILRYLGGHSESDLKFEEVDGVSTLIRSATIAQPLHEMMDSVEKLDLEGQLNLALGICREMERIHQRGVIHKDVNPSNILWNQETGEVEFIDFGISTQLRNEASELAHPDQLEGTLAYMSPEQTGRLRRSIDQRSDLYSLGATLYEIFSMRIPFETDDSAEMLHAHLAVIPIALSERIPEIPQAVSEIVAILLAKEPEKRYRTAGGLAADFECCLEELKKNGVLTMIPLRELDSMEFFRIPNRLYGRDAEIDRLLNTFSEVISGEFRMMLIKGFPGIGKSALVHEIQKPVIQWRAHFTSGKFDQLQRNVPYATLIQAFRQLILQILKGTASKVRIFKRELLSQVGRNGQVLIDLIPDIELIIGHQPEVPQLPPQDAENRFYRVLSQFIRVFTSEDHPLVLFLDDLQWTDSATLKVIERMATSREFPYVFLIGAYRDNEVDEGHPLSLMLRNFQQKQVECEVIEVTPLGEEPISELIGDTLHCKPDSVRSLAQLCLKKTGGNPFYLIQFLNSLHHRELIHFDSSPNRWTWSEDLIRSQHVTDNVVELMSRQIRDLPARTQSVLQLAACIGNRFDLETLSVVAESDSFEVMTDLWEALVESLIQPENSSYRYAKHHKKDAGFIKRPSKVWFRFLHDRVQEACFALIDETKVAALQLKIGRMLTEQIGFEDLKDKGFEILRHYNAGISLVTGKVERKKLARLNLEAGKKAKASAAYEPAVSYLDHGLRLLGESDWDSDYPFCFELHLEALEARNLCNDYAGMEALGAKVISKVTSIVDRAAVEEVRIQALMGRNKPVSAIELALPILRELGVNLPSKPNQFHIISGLAATELKLRKIRIEDLLNLPEMSDPEKLAAIRILYFVFSSCYFAMPTMYPLLMFEIIRLSLAFGNTPASAIGYSAYGVVQCGLLRRIEYGNRFGKLSLDLVEKLGAREIRPRVIQVTQGFVTVYQTHPNEFLEDFLEGYQIGLEVGDFEFAGFTAHMHCFFLLWMGTPLGTVDAEMRTYTSAIAKLNQSIPLYQQNLWHQFVANLRGQAPDPTKMIGEHYDESKMIEVHEEANDAIALFFNQCCNVILGVLFDDNESAIRAAVAGMAMNRKGAGMGSTTVPVFYGWSALAWIEGYRNGHPDHSRRKMRRNAKRCITILEKWTKAAPAHAEFRLSLARAELAAVDGNHSAAIDHFHDSLKQAKTHRSPIDTANALHRMGRYFMGRGHEEMGGVYLNEAVSEYRRWQADGILEHLLNQYSDADIQQVGANADDDTGKAFAQLAHSTWSHGTDRAPKGDMIDLASVMKSTQALSGEIILEELLEIVMRIMIQNAGANRGCLILLKDGQMKIEAECAAHGEEITVLKSLPLTEKCERGTKTRVPRELINYVARKREAVILDDAARFGDFITDPYIAGNQSRSILCIPLTNRGHLVGILHLENTISRSAFSIDRVNVLKVLSAQAAISIENARLYNNLDSLNRSYARFVPHQFLEILKKQSITDVRLGDQIQEEMTVIFTDILGFTGISESLTPEANFQFVNEFLSHMEPAVSANGGFIDKFIGDAIMAIFPTQADDAVRASLSMLKTLRVVNKQRKADQKFPIQVGIGINTGTLMLGVVGGESRLDTTVISKAVNLANRLEMMTRDYGASLLISEHTKLQLRDRSLTDFIRKIDHVTPKGSRTAVDVYEIYASDPRKMREAKSAHDEDFQNACRTFQTGNFIEARKQFLKLASEIPGDLVIDCYLSRCNLNADHVTI